MDRPERRLDGRGTRAPVRVRPGPRGPSLSVRSSHPRRPDRVCAVPDSIRVMSGLRREPGLLEALVYGVGLVLGAGIYAILGEATGVTGGSIVFAFLLAALVASFTGLSYAELASLYPKAEGDYIYVREAFDFERLRLGRSRPDRTASAGPNSRSERPRARETGSSTMAFRTAADARPDVATALGGRESVSLGPEGL